MTTDHPPAFEATSSIELQSVTDSKITSVSLYSTRAEITRYGQNQVNIAGLPNALEAGRCGAVEGRGAATIHDVTVSTAKGEHIPTSSPKLVELLSGREKKVNALTGARGAGSLEQYLGSLTVEHLEVSKLENVLEGYEAAGEKLDARKAEMTEDLGRIDAEIAAERALIAVPHENNKLRTKAAIGIALIYAVPFATWTAFYDIRNPVALIYRRPLLNALYRQSWDDVPLQLETSTPTFGLRIPKLSPWNLDLQQPRWRLRTKSIVSIGFRSMAAPPAPTVRFRGGLEEAAPDMSYAGTATFRVPGLVTIPCDDAAHNFTIVELSLKAAMSWVSVPKLDAKTHLNLHFALMVPGVSPQESFDCPLGNLDSSIRITYHPVIKKLSQSGFYNKSANYVFAQRITIFNTKSIAAERVKIVDQIPVKLVNPALKLPSDAGASGATKGAPKDPQVVSVFKGVKAHWDGADQADCEVETLGLDRKVNWICSVPAQEKINLALEWEVTVSPASAQVMGL
ncbi:hypothetical protein B0H17DRAFT_1097651 [Mycena rosella]|uniref:DUF4139 domain-containing protein n=1 Tax=Mycena rosella TaxID=1033263 RepID=A0AAD7CSH4_MYCRO|nr:hypothetical protein B0H17DRAFT_1097651 [Mycena rosella]